jgi:hypothetical protein
MRDLGGEGELRLDAEEVGDIVDDGFEVVRRLVELPDPLVDARLIVQSDYDQSAIDRSPTPSGILQYVFCLVQVHYRLIEQLLADAIAPLLV